MRVAELTKSMVEIQSVWAGTSCLPGKKMRCDIVKTKY